MIFYPYNYYEIKKKKNSGNEKIFQSLTTPSHWVIQEKI
jgi:hypothetical protein